MKTVSFPDGSTVPVKREDHKFAVQVKDFRGMAKVMFARLPVHLWAVANLPSHIQCHRVIVQIGDKGQPSKVIQSIEPRMKAVMPGEYR